MGAHGRALYMLAWCTRRLQLRAWTPSTIQPALRATPPDGALLQLPAPQLIAVTQIQQDLPRHLGAGSIKHSITQGGQVAAGVGVGELCMEPAAHFGQVLQSVVAGRQGRVDDVFLEARACPALARSDHLQACMRRGPWHHAGEAWPMAQCWAGARQARAVTRTSPGPLPLPCPPPPRHPPWAPLPAERAGCPLASRRWRYCSTLPPGRQRSRRGWAPGPEGKGVREVPGACIRTC